MLHFVKYAYKKSTKMQNILQTEIQNQECEEVDNTASTHDCTKRTSNYKEQNKIICNKYKHLVIFQQKNKKYILMKV